jgi:lipoprotein-releasing system ATP-binding protein
VSDAAILRAKRLSRILNGPIPVTLVDGVDLTVPRGQFLAITGPSGSGKSSLLYLLGLLDTPSTGDVIIDGHVTASLTEADRARLRLATLGFVFQFHFLLPEFSAMENVMLPMRALARLTRAQMQERAAEILASMGLADHRHKTPDRMSGGQRQRVAIARALANAPKIILADEPTGNLDSVSTQQVFALMRMLIAEHGTTLIIVTHDNELAERADRRIHIVDGRIQSDAEKSTRSATLPMAPATT